VLETSACSFYLARIPVDFDAEAEGIVVNGVRLALFMKNSPTTAMIASGTN
jgi:hypothetical protein